MTAGAIRRALLATGCALVSSVFGQAECADGPAAGAPVATALPKVSALVAAIGDKFSVVYEIESKGSLLEPFRRSVIHAPHNALNRIALQTLDREVARARPGDKRIYLSFPAAPEKGVAPALRDGHAIAAVVAELEKMPQRMEWDRIVVATPAYKAFAHDGMASKLQGFGIFMQPLQNLQALGGPAWVDSMGGEAVIMPTESNRKSQTYLAPFAYITIWLLDPKTLAVLDKQQRFDNRKLADPMSDSLDLSQSLSREFLARHVVEQIDSSIHKAVTQTELGGKVEVREVREVGPAPAKP